MNLFTPSETAENICKSGITKGKMPLLKMILLGICAGAFIAFGAFAAITVSAGWPDPWNSAGLLKLAMGSVFPVGLMLVVLTGSELFTGNNMFLAYSLFEKKTTAGELLKNWIVVYFANFAGALIVLAIVVWGGFFADGGTATALGERAMAIGSSKAGLSFGAAFFRGIGCNWLVCLAVWLAVCSKDVIGKIFSCFFPIMLFVLVGFEHSVANMFFIPAAICVPGTTVTVSAFLLNNLIPVTLGNIAGGGIFVAGIFWAVHRKKQEN